MAFNRPDEEQIRKDAGLAHGPNHDSTLSFRNTSDLSFKPFGSDLSDTELATIESIPAGAALLLVRSGPDEGARYLLDSGVAVVGRHPEADVFFDDVTVSRRHAEVVRAENGFEIVDQRSLNGTYVNGEQVDRAPLHNGDEVRIGKFRLLFFVSPADLPQVAE